MDIINPMDAEKFLSRRLYNFNASKELAYAWNANENIILFGPGGYGKSDAAMFFFEFLKNQQQIAQKEPFVISFSQGTSEDVVLGGIDRKKFNEDGDFIPKLEESLFNHEFVVIEEIFDAFPDVLLFLKDILQSGWVRRGSLQFKIKTKFIVGLTNRSHAEVITDASTEALMQRFAFHKEVKWESHTVADYQNSLHLRLGSSQYVDYVAQLTEKMDVKPSPRTAYKATKAGMINKSISSIHSIYGFPERNPQKQIEEEIMSLTLPQAIMHVASNYKHGRINKDYRDYYYEQLRNTRFQPHKIQNHSKMGWAQCMHNGSWDSLTEAIINTKIRRNKKK